MLKRTERLIIASSIFIVAVLVFTRIDYLINSDFYGHGLQYADSWFWPYQIMYTALFQILIACLTLYTRSWRFLLVTEAFTLSGGQDLIFFGLWNMGAFPAGSWDWLLVVKLFPSLQWTSAMQIGATVLATSVAAAVAYYVKGERQLKIP